MLGAIADAVTMGGEDIKGMLRRLAPMHVRKGVSAAHMPKMGACLFSVFLPPSLFSPRVSEGVCVCVMWRACERECVK